jgi:hypothetical protein
MEAEPVVRNAVRKSLITQGGFPQKKVEEIMKDEPAMPDELVKAFIKMQKASIKFRLADDADYQKAVLPGALNKKEQFDFLRKL